MGRLLNGHVNDNFNFGAYRGSCATWYDGAKEGCSRSLPFGNLNWLNFCCIRGSSVATPNNCLVNQLPSGSSYITNTASGTLGINSFTTSGDRGSFEMSQVIIWDVPLSASELLTVSNAFNTYLTTGVLQ